MFYLCMALLHLTASLNYISPPHFSEIHLLSISSSCPEQHTMDPFSNFDGASQVWPALSPVCLRKLTIHQYGASQYEAADDTASLAGGLNDLALGQDGNDDYEDEGGRFDIEHSCWYGLLFPRVPCRTDNAGKQLLWNS